MTESIHWSPINSIYYKGSGFHSVTKCEFCKKVALREQAHPANPCYICGNRVYDTQGRWIKAKKTWYFKVIEKGYWVDKDGNRL